MTRLFTRSFLAVVLFASTIVAVTASPVAATSGLTREWETVDGQGGYFPTFTPELFSSPSVGDVTGDGQPEVVVGGMDGRVVVTSASTGAIISRLGTGNGAIQAAPTLVDLNGDGVRDILVGNVRGDVVGQTYNGVELFRKRTCTWPGKPCDVFATAAVADIDVDGQLEIITTSNDHYVHAWELNGANMPGFPVKVNDTTWASPAIADLTGDGFPEIIVAIDVDYVTAKHVGCRGFGARILVLNHLGRTVWNRCLPGEIVMSSPAVADVDADGKPEIVVGTGIYFTAIGEAVRPGHLVHVLDAAGGHEPGWPQDLGGSSLLSPSVGQLDDDPQLEIVMGSSTGHLQVYEHDGVSKYRICAMYNSGWCPVGSGGAPSAIADVDNDGRQEIITAYQNRLIVTDGRTGQAKAETLTRGPNFNQRSQPAVAQVDGVATIFRSVLEDGNGDGRISNGDRLVIDAYSTGSPLGASHWPTFRGNDQHTGSFETSWSGRGGPSGQSYTTAYSASELVDLDKAAAYLGMSRAQLQKQGVAVANFLRVLTNAKPYTVWPRPDITSGTAVTSTWNENELGILANTSGHYSLAGGETQKGGAALLIFLAGLDRARGKK